MNYKKLFFTMTAVLLMFSLMLFVGREVQAGSKDLVATKRIKYQDDNVESMRDVFARQEEDEKAYRDKMLSNSAQTIKLLTEIRDQLKKLNERE